MADRSRPRGGLLNGGLFRRRNSESPCAGDLLDCGAEQGVVENSGSWFSFAGERLGQGRETARQFLKDNPVVRQRIEALLREKLGLAAS